MPAANICCLLAWLLAMMHFRDFVKILISSSEIHFQNCVRTDLKGTTTQKHERKQIGSRNLFSYWRLELFWTREHCIELSCHWTHVVRLEDWMTRKISLEYWIAIFLKCVSSDSNNFQITIKWNLLKTYKDDLEHLNKLLL